jgi:hypothetical protein
MMTREDFNFELRKACIKYAKFDIAHVAMLLDTDLVSGQSIKIIDSWLDSVINSVGPIARGDLQNAVDLKFSQMFYEKVREKLNIRGEVKGRARARAKAILVRALERNDELRKSQNIFYISPEKFRKLWASIPGLSEMSNDIKSELEKQEKSPAEEKPRPEDVLLGMTGSTQLQNIQPQEAQNEHI